MTDTMVPAGASHPGVQQASGRSYATAVALSATLGFAGAQHFYLGRAGEGLLDLGLSVGWICSFAAGQVLLGVAFLAADLLHAFAVTILLLTGNFKDGDGCVVCYPGQKLGIRRG